MSNLDEARNKINQIDAEMIRLFEERMQAVKVVAAYKKENHLPIVDLDREKTLLEKNLSMLQNQEFKEYYRSFFEGVLKSSKNYQKELIK